MFRRRNQEPEESVSGRYHVVPVHTTRTHETLARHIEEAMNEGNAKGWHLINVTQHAGLVLLYWDTEVSS